MLVLARWIMRGTPQAVAAAALTALVPWLFWFSAAVAGLVTLRRGMTTAAPVLIAAALPAGWWWVQGDAVPLASILLVTLMATVLRSRMRWAEALIVGSVVCMVMVQLGIFLPAGGTGSLLTELRQSSSEVARMLDQLSAQGVDTEMMAALVIGGATGLVVLLAGIACLALARSWQAGLYNPGGFREEFHALRLSRKQLLLLIALMVLGVVLAVPAASLLAWVPLLVAGVALVHGFIGLKGMSGFWLVGFYALLLTTWPTILIVLLLALVDTFADFRGRLTRSD
ncbi:hypothetical protein R5R73_15635 [Salinicola sp. LHM]|uniref:hypothetical protein n=1 Tax=Salinicola TaxID=404432 RepID=UPI0008DCF1AE|nr:MULTISPECIES: hypothetical protein [Salinicola]MDF3918369.1 hypothetical protein [Salinicola salarius]OHZ01882.1 hypothetical protein BC443_02405 [Salinicola sp. MIT1003]WQH32454.1 hypothetical protein R5R73_15635 [Salinicola sp. LHM]